MRGKASWIDVDGSTKLDHGGVVRLAFGIQDAISARTPLETIRLKYNGQTD
ncbi:MAG: hypothetical protein ACJ74Z_04320 [Bryobacteraceae bacterium]